MAEKTYAEQIAASRPSNMTPDQIRQSKNHRSHERRVALKTRLREEAEKRNARWQALSPLEQLAELDKRLGPGKGAVKSRAKIANKLREAEEAAKAAEKERLDKEEAETRKKNKKESKKAKKNKKNNATK